MVLNPAPGPCPRLWPYRGVVCQARRAGGVGLGGTGSCISAWTPLAGISRTIAPCECWDAGLGTGCKAPSRPAGGGMGFPLLRVMPVKVLAVG